jgi:hypothetical protein
MQALNFDMLGQLPPECMVEEEGTKNLLFFAPSSVVLLILLLAAINRACAREHAHGPTEWLQFLSELREPNAAEQVLSMVFLFLYILALKHAFSLVLVRLAF